MSYIDVAIPGAIGLWLLVWPRTLIYGSRVTPDKRKLRWLRIIGLVLLGVAACYLVVKLARS